MKPGVMIEEIYTQQRLDLAQARLLERKAALMAWVVILVALATPALLIAIYRLALTS